MTQTIINTKGHEDEIAQMYQQGVKLIDIAEEYGVDFRTIRKVLRKMKIPVKCEREGGSSRKSKYKMKERVFSPELLAKMKENTRINDERIQYVNFVRTTEDQYLVSNIINHPIIG
uniref:Uncharacterized protein n=1 Tax=viral metagenome TaxID=1070528 RepID=A0A6M3IF38_9ZZZZ